VDQPLWPRLWDSIRECCDRLRIMPMAVRSSATAEDLEDRSFAGQYETVLNVTADNLLTAYKQVLASKYSPRAIAYRLRYGLEDWDTLMCGRS
jgi:pyruvate,water dikinase